MVMKMPVAEGEVDSQVTRFEVIDGSGRAYVVYNADIEVCLQDEGRTMKVFIRERSVDAGPHDTKAWDNLPSFAEILRSAGMSPEKQE